MRIHSVIPCVRERIQSAYTLIEVLSASAIIAVSMAASVSLSSTLMLQEELSWRVAVTRNYQENMARLWQLGISTTAPSIRTVMTIMPDQANNPVLNRIINGTPTIISAGTTNPSNLGTMEVAFVSASANISTQGIDGVENQGSPFTLTVYRPNLPSTLRPPKP
ncbi:MAG: prepilin-type N-terminal cleavage/methylation domain-containing protein [Verrucomicrobia bacterium]|nr:prepilin-type N-terminal cleavage/methylation domain-containing protein [Verrucomicrobiota bacterium]